MAGNTRSTALNRLQVTARLARTALAARLVEHGFYAGQEQVMIALSRQDGLTPGGLASLLGVRPPTVTKTIARLQAQGMLEKRASLSDHRQSTIHLTEKGSQTIRAIEKSIRKTEKLVFRGIDKKEQKRLSRLLASIEANLSGIEPASEFDDSEDEVELTQPSAVA